MEDKEIGELWAKAKLPVVFQLIEKLVEERATIRWWATKLKGNALNRRNIRFALECFGIPPESWPGK